MEIKFMVFTIGEEVKLKRKIEVFEKRNMRTQRNSHEYQQRKYNSIRRKRELIRQD